MYLVKASQQEGMKLVKPQKMSPQKNYKTNPDATHNILTYKVVLIEM